MTITIITTIPVTVPITAITALSCLQLCAWYKKLWCWKHFIFTLTISVQHVFTFTIFEYLQSERRLQVLKGARKSGLEIKVSLSTDELTALVRRLFIVLSSISFWSSFFSKTSVCRLKTIKWIHLFQGKHMYWKHLYPSSALQSMSVTHAGNLGIKKFWRSRKKEN